MMSRVLVAYATKHGATPPFPSTRPGRMSTPASRRPGYRVGLAWESRKSVTTRAKAGPNWGTGVPPLLVQTCTVDPPTQPYT